MAAEAIPEGLSEIMEAREKSRKLWWLKEKAHEAYKAAKAEYDGSVDDLMAVIDRVRSGQQTLPFGQDPAPASGADADADQASQELAGDPADPAEATAPTPLPPPPAGAGESWKAQSLAILSPYGLSDKVLDNLNDAEIFTLGQLADYTAKQDVTTIGGIGPAKAQRIAEVLGRFWAEHESAAGTEELGE